MTGKNSDLRLRKIMFVLFILISAAAISIQTLAEPKTLYSELEKENLSDEESNVLREYYGDLLASVGYVSRFNTIAAKNNIAIINLTVEGKDSRILARLSDTKLFGSNDLVSIGRVNNLTVLGNLAVFGLGYYNPYSDFGERKLFIAAGTEPKLLDEGTSKLTKGFSNVSINPVFASLIEDYKVYLSPEGKTKGLYVAEKAEDYFIVKAFTPSSNVKFSYMISGVRNYDFEELIRFKDYEIKVSIDYEAGNAEVFFVNYLYNNSNYNESTNESAENTTEQDSSLTLVTGNLVEFGDINEILDNSTTNFSENASADNLIPNATNETTIDNSTNDTITNETISENIITNETITISKIISENFVLNSTDEDYIMLDIASRLGLSQDDVKTHIKFEYKISQDFEDEKDGDVQTSLKSYIEINGSVIIRLGVK